MNEERNFAVLHFFVHFSIMGSNDKEKDGGDVVKFSELTEEQWEEWGPYLDTCILPVTGLNGTESPIEAGYRLEKLRDWLDGIEMPFRGRTVTYPAYHFVSQQLDDDELRLLNGLCTRLRRQGFAYIVVVSAQLPLTSDKLPAADLVITPAELMEEEAGQVRSAMKICVQNMWSVTQTQG